jgi:hypothetical protein
MLTLNIVTGLAMMVLTIIIHSVFMVVGAKIAKWRRSHFGNIRKETAKAVLLSGLTIWLFLAIVIEAGLWSMFYLLNPMITALPDLETAFYLSMVTFTTLGFGDVVLTGQWRLLALQDTYIQDSTCADLQTCQQRRKRSAFWKTWRGLPARCFNIGWELIRYIYMHRSLVYGKYPT